MGQKHQPQFPHISENCLYYFILLRQIFHTTAATVGTWYLGKFKSIFPSHGYSYLATGWKLYLKTELCFCIYTSTLQELVDQPLHTAHGLDSEWTGAEVQWEDTCLACTRFNINRLRYSNCYKESPFGAEEMAQRLRAFATLTEDLYSVSRNQLVAYNDCYSSSKEFHVLFQPPWVNRYSNT